LVAMGVTAIITGQMQIFYMNSMIYSQIRDIAERVRITPSIHFWDEDNDGNIQDLKENHIIRYLNEFLPEVGIYNLPDQDTKGVPHHQLIYCHENRAEKIDEQQFESIIRKVLEESGYKEVYHRIHFKKSQFFGKNVPASAPYLEDKKILRDSKSSAYRLFDNGYVEVTCDAVSQIIPYTSLPESCIVWSHSISAREYHPNEQDLGSHHFRHFVENLSRDINGKVDQKSFERLQVVIGYLCHRCNHESERKCVVLIDRVDDPNLIGESNGGTGKSLLVKCLAQVVNTINIDGKAFKKSKEDRFALAGVNEAHELVHFDDAAKKFSFEDIFPHITGDFHIRRIGQNPTAIPGHRAPKIVITTNHPISGTDTSSIRRQVLVQVSPHYRYLLEQGITPKDVHDGMEFCSSDWRESDWNEFYEFIFECIQKYLKQGLPMLDEEMEIQKQSQLIRLCGHKDLLDAIRTTLEGSAANDEEVFCEQYYAQIREQIPGLQHSDIELLGLLKNIAENQGYLFNPHKNGDVDKQRLNGERWNRWNELGLDRILKKTGTPYQKDDRVTVFRISREGSNAQKKALELILERS
jgi:hypothetical protein